MLEAGALCVLLILAALTGPCGGTLRGRGHREPDLRGVKMGKSGFLVFDKDEK